MDLVGVNFDVVLDHLLHVFGVEIAQAHGLDSFVFGNVPQGFKILRILVLSGGIVPHARLVRLPTDGKPQLRYAISLGKTYKLPMELQKIDPLGLQPLTPLGYAGPNGFTRDFQRVEDAVFRGGEK